MEESKHRVFVGITVPLFVYEKLKQSLSAYEHLFSSGHWILPENVHVTIRFFGDISSEQLNTLRSEIKSKVHHRLSFAITVDKISLFPHDNSTLIVAYVKLNPEIQHLHTLIKDISIHSISDREPDFIPHITLYRNKNNLPLKLPAITVQDCQFTATALTLYESVLIDNKRMYRPLFSEPFKNLA